MQIEHKKNTAYYLVFPMVDKAAPESFKSLETVTDTAYYKDGAGAWTALPIVDTVSEIGTTGVYEIDLTAAELNHDKVLIKMTAANSADTAFLLDMRSQLAGDLPLAAPIADAVWDELTAAHRIAGSFGLAMQFARAFAGNKKIVYHAQSNKLEIYDDDGTTLLRTLTPTKDTVGNKTTITPS